jgi:transcriptional regulator with XRE-family HTH domain
MKPGHAIKILRTAAGLRQTDLAERVGVTPSYLSLVESGRRSPSLRLLRRTSEALRIPLGLFLLWGEDADPRGKTTSAEHVAALRAALVEAGRLALEADRA